MPKGRSPAQKAAEEAKALELHAQGYTERQIADRMTDQGMSISQPTVHRRIQDALTKYIEPQHKEARLLELARIEAVLNAQAVKLESGDPQAARLVLSAIELKAKLLGLNAPEVTKVETTSSEAERALQARIAQAQADLPAVERYANGDSS